MGYKLNVKSDWTARPICGSDEFLKNCEPQAEISGAEWIWPLFSTRGFLRRDFFVEGEVLSARAEFICDNGFDIYFGENLFAENTKHVSADITEYIKQGENSVALRVFQTNDILRFGSAIAGKIVVSTDMGEKEIVTDGSFHNFHPEFSNSEPENWLSAPALKEAYLCIGKIHPRLARRSLYMRKRFSSQGEIKEAKLFVFSRGEAEMYLNGEKVGNEFFSQGIVDKYNEYRVFDVKDMIKDGENVVAAITGNGWLNNESHNVIYNHKNELLAELHIKYSDAREQLIKTDGSWKIKPSPIKENDLQFGERYDARLEEEGFSLPEYRDGDWDFAEELPLDCSAPYVERSYPPVRVTQQLSAKEISVLEDGILYDFGINCAGSYKLCLKGTKAGQVLKISVCEMLKENGEMQLSPYAPVCNSDDFYKADGRAKAAVRNYDVYICRGGEESYMPRFAFNGFRYIKIEGATLEQIAGIKLAVMHNDIAFGWHIESEDPFFQSFAEKTERSMRGNMINGFMDCPTREKNFWTGDIGMFAPTACYLGDVESLLSRWTDAGRKLDRISYGWGDEIYTIPLELYHFYGDKEFLTSRYKEILAFTYARVSKVDGALPSGENSPYNDHLNPYGKNLDGAFFSGCFYCYNLACVAEIAEILGDRANAERLRSYHAGAVERFNRRYFLAEENDYSPRIQSGLVLPLAFGIVPADKKAAVADTLARYINEQGSLTTGIVATRFLMQVLCENGKLAEAYRLLAREDFPSWRNLTKNATTITEHWDGMVPSGCSKNHFALGALTGWMFECLGGISYKDSAPAFSSVVLRPYFIKELGSFACSYASRSGDIKTSWKIEGDKAVYKFSAAVSVEVILPNGEKKRFPEGSGEVEFSLTV